MFELLMLMAHKQCCVIVMLNKCRHTSDIGVINTRNVRPWPGLEMAALALALALALSALALALVVLALALALAHKALALPFNAKAKAKACKESLCIKPKLSALGSQDTNQ